MAAPILLSRRSVLTGALLAPAIARSADRLAERREDLQRRLDEAAHAGRPFVLPRGVTTLPALTLPSGAILRGAAEGSTLVLTKGPLTAPRFASGVAVQNLAIERAGGEGAIIDLVDVTQFSLSGLVLSQARDGIRLERCAGRIERSTIRDCSRAALFSLDSGGLRITDNLIESCGDNGLQIWGGVQRQDGSRIAGNRIRRIRNRSGGTGEYGNGVSIFRAGGIVCERNMISDCAFSALRNNSGHGVSFVENVCLDSGETAIFAEFAWRNAVIRDNLVDRAGSGIQLVNFAEHGGRGGVCTGNVIRNVAPSRETGDEQWGYGVAIKAEADTLVARNRIENARWIGIMAGWGEALSKVTVEDNRLSDCGLALAGSVAPGAGAATIRSNRIERPVRAGLVGMEWTKVVTPDLAAGPDGSFRNLAHARNLVS